MPITSCRRARNARGSKLIESLANRIARVHQRETRRKCADCSLHRKVIFHLRGFPTGAITPAPSHPPRDDFHEISYLRSQFGSLMSFPRVVSGSARATIRTHQIVTPTDRFILGAHQESRSTIVEREKKKGKGEYRRDR